MQRLPVFLLLLVPLAASAQEGTIRYDRVVRYEADVPPELEAMRDRIPPERVTPMVLHFTSSESLMRAVPDTAAPADSDTELLLERLLLRDMGSRVRRDNATLQAIHIRSRDGTVTEAREFLGETYLVTGDRPEIRWALAGQQGEFLGYLVLKATSTLDGAEIEAWFTPEIPVSGGPGPFGGLPGMILVVSVDDARLEYAATGVSFGVEDGVIAPPTAGQPVSQHDYEHIVAEALHDGDALEAGTPVVTEEDIEEAPQRPIEEVLMSRFPGVLVGRGQGGALTIRIRGAVGSDEPLYVLDGVAVDAGPGGTLDMVAAADIESIRVLKDAASMTMYGVRGGAGIIVITTK